MLCILIFMLPFFEIATSIATSVVRLETLIIPHVSQLAAAMQAVEQVVAEGRQTICNTYEYVQI
jgi:hypothetical protein